MSQTDPIADFLTRIRNAAMAKQRYTDVLWSTLIQNMAEVLKHANFIDEYLVREEDGKHQMRVFLKYDPNGQSIIHDLKRVSKPGNRVYSPSKDIASVVSGLGISIMSTSQGIISGHEARKRGVGGEVLCYVW